MIQYEKITLNNGLRLLVNENKDTSICTVNALYDVGSRDENPNKTGIAHLLEHLMFEGSQHISSYDNALQMAGGESNAFTNSDTTNYYLYLPAQNIETAFWLESDRLLGLNLTEEKVAIQKKVVLEEFEETTHDIPYGMAWHKLRNLAYKVHPYKWPVIGEKMEHIEQTFLPDILKFYETHYQPQNSVWVVTGPNKTQEIVDLAEKWLGSIPNKKKYQRNLKAENWETRTFQELNLTDDVPAQALYFTFLMPHRNHPDYYACEFISDVLATGQSCRLIQEVVKQNQIFSHIDCFVTGDIDEGLFVIEGRVATDVKIEEAEQAIWQILEELQTNKIGETELERVKNQIESHITFSETSGMNMAINLALYEQIGNAEEINLEVQKIRALTAEHILEVAQRIFKRDNCCLLRYVF